MVQESDRIRDEQALTTPLATTGRSELSKYMATIQLHLLVAARSALRLHQCPSLDTSPLAYARTHILYLEFLRHPEPLTMPHDNFRLLSAQPLTYAEARTRSKELLGPGGTDALALSMLNEAEHFNHSHNSAEDVCVYVMPFVRTPILHHAHNPRENIEVISEYTLCQTSSVDT